MYFTSPTKGKLSFDKVYEDILDFVKEMPKESYKIIIGTDSQLRDEVCFVTAIIVHRIGKGARYYYTRKRERKITSLRQRIFYEASLSLGLASKMAEKMASNGISKSNVEIHLDVGNNGETKELVRDIIGMVVSSGFDAKIKPNSYGASKVADKYTK